MILTVPCAYLWFIEPLLHTQLEICVKYDAKVIGDKKKQRIIDVGSEVRVCVNHTWWTAEKAKQNCLSHH